MADQFCAAQCGKIAQCGKTFYAAQCGKTNIFLFVTF